MVVMRDDVFEAFLKFKVFPAKKVLHNFIRDQKDISFAECNHTQLLRKEPVQYKYAEGLVAYLNEHKTELPLEILNLNLSVESIFRLAEKEELHYRVTLPSKANDAALRGLGFVLRLISPLAPGSWHKYHLKNRNEIYDLVNDVKTYTNFTLFNAGRDEAQGTSKSFSIARLIELGMKHHLGRHLEEYIGFLRMVCSINPRFCRFAMTNDGKIAGFTIVFCISEEAYVATVRGEHTSLSYRETDIVPSSNNLVLFSYAEAPSVPKDAKEVKRNRFALQKGLMYHIASLLKLPFDHRFVRAISYDVQATNAKRLKRVGFRPIEACNATGPGCKQVLKFEHESMGFFKGALARLLFENLRNIRLEIDHAELHGKRFG
jgi:hypothetical protein